MPAIGLVVSPGLHVRVPDLAMVPTEEGHVRDVVGPGGGGLPQGRSLVVHAALDGRALDGHHLAGVEHVVHGVLPVARNGGVPQLVLRALLKLPQTVHGPFVELSGRRDHAPLLVEQVLGEVAREEEAADGNRLSGRVVLVRHEVRPQDHNHAGLRLHLVEFSVLGVVWQQLQRAGGGTQEDADHDLVPEELRHPLHNQPLVEWRRLLLVRLTGAVHDRQAAMGHVKAQVV
mmetsp:Transcript_78317/g.207882  ORF Transcript_78317/g.207882 Transcript_78317/m.207882 type:complete len:231 (+) Transcript_78317:2179-2871(+)